jgi:lipid-A-disaccharide synthase
MSITPRTIFFSVGEPSGDLHGANLIRALRRQDPDIRLIGFGGPKMQQAGMTLHADLTQLAVMWILQAVMNIHKFWRLVRQTDHHFTLQRPDAVVLIDFPGFNWWIARVAKKHGVPVFYYGAPQMWAWAAWRIRKMRRLVDQVICKLPFEAQWYRERGCPATYVGHPYFDELTTQVLDPEFMRQHQQRPGRLVTILPGSRTQEVKNNLSWFIKAAGLIASQVPDARFAIASFNEKQAVMARETLGQSELPIEIFVNRTSELIELSSCCMACSGSVSLELMYRRRPSVILYWVNRGSYFLAKYFFLRVKYMTLVNLLACEDRFENPATPYDPDAPGAEQVPFPEYPTYQDRSPHLAAHIVQWLNDPAAREFRVQQLTELKARFCSTGATRAAADQILRTLSANSTQPRENRPSQAA